MNWLDQEQKLFLGVFKRLPLEVERGDGCYLFDRSGKKYLDFLSGLGVNALGYCHPAVVKAVQNQLKRNLHLSNYFIQDVQLRLAGKILEMSGYDRLFFTNSGTESIEGILKLVKKFANQHHKHQIITFRNAFHGRSLGSLSITAQEKYQKEFQPLLPQVIDVPYNDAAALRRMIGPQTAAIFLEFIQGEGGVIPVSAEIVELLRDAQKRFGILVVADEIQSGIGRTGKFLAFQHYNIQPDLVAIAKAVGGGLPLGAFLLREELNQILARGEHGTTFGGNPAACAAGLATLQVFESEDILTRVRETGAFLNQKLRHLKEELPEIVEEVRGVGLMQGMQIKGKAFDVVLEGIRQGVILNSTAGNVIRFLPPLIVTPKQIDRGIAVLKKILVKQSQTESS